MQSTNLSTFHYCTRFIFPSLFLVFLGTSSLNAQAPTITSFTPLSGSVGTLITILGTNLYTPTDFSIGGINIINVNNTDTTLVGMIMPGTNTGVISVSTFGGMASSSSYFTVTPTSYPSVQQGGKLVGTGVVGGANQGQSVDVSADGNTVIMGGPFDSLSIGAAWVFTYSGGVWTQQGLKLAGTGTNFSYQGFSVAISGDGNTAIVGGFKDNSFKGAAWIFVRSGGVWTQQGSKLVGYDAIDGTQNDGAQQGYSVDISADGNTAIIGGLEDNAGEGAAWIFTRSAGTWAQQGPKLVGTGSVFKSFGVKQGASVSISGDGNTAIVGGYYDNDWNGAAWVFTRQVGNIWTQQGFKLVGTGGGGSWQGYSVSISVDGNTAILGGRLDNNQVGAAWIFTRSGGVWTQQGSKLVGTGAVGNSNQGYSVSISGDGNTAIVGGSEDSSYTGAAWTFTRVGGVWTQMGSKLVNWNLVQVQSGQGTSVAISGNGNTVMVGSPGESSYKGTEVIAIFGAVTPYRLTGGVWTIMGPKLEGTGVVALAYQGNAVAISADGNTAIVGGNWDNTQLGAVWVFSRLGALWSQQGAKLVGIMTGGVSRLGNFQGTSVAISADGNTAIVGGTNDNSKVGGSWIFTRVGGMWTQQGTKLVGLGYVINGFFDNVNQGTSVAISADGNTAVVGGPADSSGQGAVWIFTRSVGVWTQQGPKLVGTSSSNAYGSHQGYSVSISAEGNTVIVGGPADSSGAAWIFTRSGGVWAQQGSKLVGTGSTNQYQYEGLQGSSVSISADGNTAIIGGSSDNFGAGASWVFTRSGGVWTQEGVKLVGTGAVNGSVGARQGKSVSISADGNAVVLSGYNDNFGAGASWVFTRSGGVWAQQGAKLVGTGAKGQNGASQGSSIALSADGNTTLIGGFYDDRAIGAAWVFTSPLLLPVKLIEFTGERQGNNNVLHWLTSSEKNNKGFDLQKSANGENFSSIAFVNTKAMNANGTTTIRYSFTDKKPLNGNNYYRLNQIDKDGKGTLSKIVLIKKIPDNETIQVTLLPNPTTKCFRLSVQSESKEAIDISIYNSEGKKIEQIKKANFNNIIFGEKYTSGYYLIEVRQNEKRTTVIGVRL